MHMEEGENIRIKDVLMGVGGALPLFLPLELLGQGPAALAAGLAGGVACYVYSDQIAAFARNRIPVLQEPQAIRKWLVSRGPDVAEVESPVQAEEAAQPKDEREYPGEVVNPASIFTVPDAADTGGVRRLTIEEIVEHVEPNSFKVWLGRSMTKPDNPAVLVNFYKQHFRFMGASQRGKSSMVAAFLDIVTRTHDRQHVLLALLDKENLTSNLFAHLPHVATIGTKERKVKLHATSNEQVLEHLTYIVNAMEQRYALMEKDMQALQAMPILLVYIEEFLSLKNHFKEAVNRARGQEAKDKAFADYRTLVYCIEELAMRGLKARIQLVLSAQVEYADDDFREAMASVGCGMAFCIRPTAAASAGFRNGPLLKRNALDNKIGQGVVETPDCNDLVLAPEFDLEKKLLVWQKSQNSKQTRRFSDDEGQLWQQQQQVSPMPSLPYKGDEKIISRAKSDLELVVNAVNEHPFATYRELAEMVGFGKDKVGELLKEARERGLISPPQQQG